MLELFVQGRPFWDSFFGYHNFQRFISVVNSHQEPWWFFVLVLVIASLPLTPLLIFGLVRSFSSISIKAVGIEKKPEDLEKKYSEALLDSIKNFWSDENQKKLKLQRETINTTYSWNTRSVEWNNFFDNARKLKT